MVEPGPNPFEPPIDHGHKSNGLSHDPSIENEPHLTQETFDSDPSELAAEAAVAESAPSVNDEIDHSVWDEPGLSSQLSGRAPEDAKTYRSWLLERIAETTAAQSLQISVGIALASGVFAVGGALFWGLKFWNAVVSICLIGPLTEEVMKVSFAVWVVEKRPYLFKSGAQILMCTAVSGLVFAVVENLLYLNVYVKHPPAWLGPWRWTVCVALHTGCSFVAGFGLRQVWADSIKNLARPRLSLGSRFLVAAVVVHCLYNFSAVVLWSAAFSF